MRRAEAIPKGSIAPMSSAASTRHNPLIAGIETLHAIKNGQLRCSKGLVVSDADRFYSLASRRPPAASVFARLAPHIATEPIFSP